MPQTTPPSLTPQDALVMMMIAASVSDEHIRTSELVMIQALVNNLPVFSTYDMDRFPVLSQTVFDLLEEEDGLDALFGLVRDSLPEQLSETAYALCVDVVAADGRLREAELRFLEEIRHELGVERLAAAGIERGARARHMTL